MIRVAGLVIAAVLVLPACGVSDLAFDQDQRIEITSPGDRDEVSLPVEVRWRAKGLRTSRTAGPFYAVFVDQEPMRPGQSIETLADDDCRRQPNCPDLTYLRDRYVFVTEQPRVELTTLPRPSSSTRTGAAEAHEATIVLLDREGRRIGESSWTVEFRVEET
jgi:hypothetical protein